MREAMFPAVVQQSPALAAGQLSLEERDGQLLKCQTFIDV